MTRNLISSCLNNPEVIYAQVSLFYPSCHARWYTHNVHKPTGSNVAPIIWLHSPTVPSHRQTYVIYACSCVVIEDRGGPSAWTGVQNYRGAMSSGDVRSCMVNDTVLCIFLFSFVFFLFDLRMRISIDHWGPALAEKWGMQCIEYRGLLCRLS